MSTTLGSITLPLDLIWQDEFSWNPIQQTQERTVTGVLLVEQGVKQGGRPITLVGGESYGWCDRNTLLQLQSSLSPNTAKALTLEDGRTFQVIWDSDNPLEAQPIVDYSAPDNSDLYSITLRFITA